LKNYIKFGLGYLLFVVLLAGCSTKKNTWTSRTSQAMNTRFNVYFNGMISYEEGLKNIQHANVEDYSSIIPMYPISRHSNATSAVSNMDRTIEKCRKAIKLHSIKVKPDKNYKKSSDPKYKLYYSQQEFNPALKAAWLLLAQAEFHKADFIGSAATFAYVSRLYSSDNDMVSKCQLWIARAYGEANWMYEAEEVLSKLDQNKLNRQNIGLYASVNADLLLKKHQYKEAIPFLKLALSNENDGYLKQRFGYLLAQLYKKNGDNKAAYDAFTTVIKSNPPFEMDFNSRISRAQIAQGEIVAVQKDLRKMLKNVNNADYLDQIYYALGNTYLNHSDTLNAIKNFELSAEKSTRNGVDKAITLIKLGDLQYNRTNYVAAQPCYEGAVKIITKEHDDFERVSRRAEMLGELVGQMNIVTLQDSLQRLSLMTQNERVAVVDKLIARLIADEKVVAEKEQKKRKNENGDEFERMTPIGGNMPSGAIGDWYFYNVGLMRSGESDFHKKWGKRKLEDNWRRTNKTASLFADEAVSPSAGASAVDTLKTTAGATTTTTDVKSPEFYLSQIPVTKAQIDKSNAETATALYNVGLLYKDKIEDFPLAIKAFQEFARRFPADTRVPDTYYNSYMIQSKLDNQPEAQLYRSKLIAEFPTSEYAKMLSQPDYVKRMAAMYNEQDSIYNRTYKAYNENRFDNVFQNVEYIKKNYPLSTLMPKFLFLNALSIGKSSTPDKFEKALTELVSSYPQSDVSSMSKDILALMKQGQHAQTGTTGGSLIAKREQITKTEIENLDQQKFTADKKSKHRLMLVSSTNTANSNKLLYNIASFNFSRFMIKDFDLVVNKLDSVQSALSVTNFESYDEADWYSKTLTTDALLTQLLNDLNIRKIIISEANFALLRTGSSLNDYLVFSNNSVEMKQAQKETTIVASKSQEQIAKKPIIAVVIDKPVADLAEKSVVVKTPTKTEQVKNEVNKPALDNKVNTPASVTTPAVVQPKEVNKPVLDNKVNTPTSATTPAVVQPKVEEPPVPLFKNLYGYRANEAHFIAIYIVSGTIDFEKVKTVFDSYNSKNYSVMNLKVSLETAGKKQVIIIGSLSDANIAKSYLLRMVKESGLFEGLKNANYRNLIGSKKNLNTLMQQSTLDVYFEFMKEYYLK
jgi:tetratricopeptide (TPR) repeat protein